MDTEQQQKLQNRETRATHLAAALQPWRQVLVRADALLHWERPLALGCLLASLTLIFALLALTRPPPLACLSACCLLAVAADFTVPSLLAPLLFGEAWSDADQSCYTAVCRRLSARLDAFQASCRRIVAVRREQPRLFAVSAGGGLLGCAIIGASVSGLLLAYTLALAALLWPGLTHYGLLSRAARDLRHCIGCKLGSA